MNELKINLNDDIEDNYNRIGDYLKNRFQLQENELEELACQVVAYISHSGFYYYMQCFPDRELMREQLEREKEELKNDPFLFQCETNDKKFVIKIKFYGNKEYCVRVDKAHLPETETQRMVREVKIAIERSKNGY